MDETTLVALTAKVKAETQPRGYHSYAGAPMTMLLDVLDEYLSERPMPEEVRAGLLEIQRRLENSQLLKDGQRDLGRLRAVLGGIGTQEIEGGEAWAEQARTDLGGLAPELRRAWNALIVHCTTAEPAKPTKKWLAQAGELVAKLGGEEFKRLVMKWFPLVARPRPVHREPKHSQSEPDPDLLITDRNATIMRQITGTK
jgi:hypothetical protein